MKNKQNLPSWVYEKFKETWDAFFKSSKAASINISIDQETLSALQRVWPCSDFVAKNCIQHPELLHSLIATGDLKRRYDKNEYDERVEKALANVDNISELKKILRDTRRREMLRIAIRDIAFLSDYHLTVKELSEFADACIKVSLNILHLWGTEKWGSPLSQDGEEQKMLVIAMGKLGAKELNFSSDIDLIFAYPCIGQTDKPVTPVSNEEFFIRIARSLIDVLGTMTEDGFVFRVDMRLRPYGDTGPLVVDLDSMEDYYQTQGREWERYAWIKARAVTGSIKDKEQLARMINPFIYRRYLDYNIFESLREMKQMISNEVLSKGLSNNIKLGPGGIREIEFICQTFQLIRGGRISELRERNILKVMKSLSDNNFITPDTSNKLKQAYVFLRDTEHRLQEYSDQQTHALPDDPAAQKRLAFSLKEPDWESFLKILDKHRINVQNTFNHLLNTQKADEENEAFKNNIIAIWQGLKDKQEATDILINAGIDEPKSVLNMFNDLKDSYNIKHLGQLGSERLNFLLPLVLKEAAKTGHPELALKRILELVESIARRTSYISLLVENQTALSNLAKLFAGSQWIAKLLIRHPVLLDELIDPRTLYDPPSKKTLKKDLERTMSRIPDNDIEEIMEELRIFKQANTLRVAAADISGALDTMKVSDRLTYIAETILDYVIDLAFRQVEKKYGAPGYFKDGKKGAKGFAVAAYGKLGGIELGYGSDLDLVFLYAGSSGEDGEGTPPIDTGVFFSRLGQRIIHILTTRTFSGILYEIDMRLRPSGDSGVLVSNIDAFSDYQINKAWTWEHQAIIRARIIAGDPYIADHFTKIRKMVIAKERQPSTLLSEVKDMRQRMRKENSGKEQGKFDIKHDPGGIVDIEFIVQYIILLNAHKNPDLLKWTDNVRQLDEISMAGIIPGQDAKTLKNAYLAYRSRLHRLNLQEKSARINKDEFKDIRHEIIKIWERIMEQPI